LAALASLEITVCHMPPGTSKWNKMEHRLFSHISMNWRGRPLTSHDVIIDSIAATTTRTELTVHAPQDRADLTCEALIRGNAMPHQHVDHAGRLRLP
jgi:hypothetical protein